MDFKEYNRKSVVEYARKWALKRNPDYYNFDKLGGDCTNFASQCIYAGSGVMNHTPIYGWFYKSLSDRTASWTGVRFLYDFLIGNKSVGPFAVISNENEIEPGDVVQLGDSSGRFYHTPVVTKVYPEILVCAHTDDALDRPLRSYTYDVARFLHIQGVRIY